MENVSVPNFGTENDWLREIEEVFQERNELYKSWEERIEERKKELLEREEKVRASERASAEREEKLMEEQQRLAEKKKDIEELLSIQEKNKVELEEKSKHIIREKIDLEKRKNQYLSMDTCREKDTENRVCLEDYILRTEVEEKYIPSSRLFTRLDELKEGDLFYISVCGKTLAYEVNKIEVIEPDDMEKLYAVSGEDLVSLITCTPYGVNTHRLVVTGKRVPFQQRIYEGIQAKPFSFREFIFTALPFLFVAIGIGNLIRNRRRDNEKLQI